MTQLLLCSVNRSPYLNPCISRLLHTTQIYKIVILYSFAVRQQRAGTGWGQNEGGKKRWRGSKAWHISLLFFAAVLTPCIISLFSNFNFLEAGEQTTWEEVGVDNTPYQHGDVEPVLASCDAKLSWIITLSLMYQLSEAKVSQLKEVLMWQIRILWSWHHCITWKTNENVELSETRVHVMGGTYLYRMEKLV